jgi:hypothetical protein
MVTSYMVIGLLISYFRSLLFNMLNDIVTLRYITANRLEYTYSLMTVSNEASLIKG